MCLQGDNRSRCVWAIEGRHRFNLCQPIVSVCKCWFIQKYNYTHTYSVHSSVNAHKHTCIRPKVRKVVFGTIFLCCHNISWKRPWKMSHIFSPGWKLVPLLLQTPSKVSGFPRCCQSAAWLAAAGSKLVKLDRRVKVWRRRGGRSCFLSSSLPTSAALTRARLTWRLWRGATTRQTADSRRCV